MYRERLGLHVVGVDATERFLSKLAGVSDPEQKRKIIGREFIAVFAEAAEGLYYRGEGFSIIFARVCTLKS
jgi:GMP synthase (glutamine-hydrolysing)